MPNMQRFEGFPSEGLQFLKDLMTNNNRPWFEAHRDAYQMYLLEPAQSFVAELGDRLQSISGAVRCDTRSDGTGVLMRFHRDTRFGQDKSPYKTNISGLFWEGAAKKTDCPAFGFRLQASGMDLMAGIFKFPKPALEAYRQAVIDEDLGCELEQDLEQLAKVSEYSIAGEYYKRVPSGYDPAHRRAALLRYDGLYVTPRTIEPSKLTTPTLVDFCFGHFQRMAPIQQWLVKMLQHTEVPSRHPRVLPMRHNR
jgi:uncharacterized protein (TIGR02453 family)